MPAPVVSRELYTERQWPSTGTWVLAPVLGLLAGLITYPLSLTAAVATCAVVTITVGLLLARTADRILVTDGTDPGLRVGRAFLDAWHIGAVAGLDAGETRHLIGPGADARAYLAQRGWIHTSVRVEVNDSADPTPYWVVSTRHPQKLVAALEAIRPPLP